MIFKVILTVLLAMSIGHTIATVDRPREPITKGSALASLFINGLVIFGLWYWA